MTTQTTSESHRKTASCFVRGVEVTVWRFTRYQIITEPDGTETYCPHSRDATLLKLPGERILWLNVAEHMRLLEALQAVTRELKTGEASPAPSGEQLALQDRMWVHRVIEWSRLHGELDTLRQDAGEVLTVLGWTDQQSVARMRLLADELERIPASKWWEDNWDGDARAVDPYGDLAGGRYPVSQWLLRRSKKRRNDAALATSGCGRKTRTSPEPEGQGEGYRGMYDSRHNRSMPGRLVPPGRKDCRAAKDGWWGGKRPGNDTDIRPVCPICGYSRYPCQSSMPAGPKAVRTS